MNDELTALDERINAAQRITRFLPGEEHGIFLALYALEASSIQTKAPLYAVIAEGFSRRLDDERKNKNVRDNGSAISDFLQGMIAYCKHQCGYFDKPSSF